MALSRTDLLGELSGNPHGTGAFTSSAFSPPSNSLLVVSLWGMEEAGGASTPSTYMTVAGGGWTYTSRANNDVASGGGFSIGLAIYTAPVSTGASMQLTIDAGANNVHVYGVSVVAYTGYDGASPIGVTGTFSEPTTDDTPNITLSANPATSSEVLATVGVDKESVGTTPGAGWSELYDIQSGTTGGIQTQIRTGSTSTNVTWVDIHTGGGSIFKSVGAAIEIKEGTLAATEPKQRLLRPLVAPVPRLVRNGVFAPLQLLGDKTTPFQGIDTTVTAVAIVTTTAMDAPTEQTGSTVAATAIAAPVALPAPTVQTGSTVAAIAVATSSTLPAPALNTGSTVAATAIDTAVAIPAPTVVVPAVIDPHQFFPGRAPMFYDLGKATQVLGDRTGPAPAVDATVSAVSIATAAALPVPALQTGSTVAATDVVTTSSLPAPTIQTGSTVSAVTVDTTTAMPAPSVVAGAASDPVQFVPGRAPMFWDLGKAAQLSGTSEAVAVSHATVTPPAIDTLTALPAPGVVVPAVTDPYQAGIQIASMFLAPSRSSFQLAGDASTGVDPNATVTPPSIDTTASLPAPAVQTGSTVSGVTVATVTALPAPTVQTGSTVTGTTIATVTALPAPSIQTAGNITIAATSIATVTDLPAPTVQQGQTVTGTTIATVTALPAPAVSGQTAITPAAIATVTTLPAPTVQTGQTVSAVTIATITALPTPVVEGLFTGIKGRGQGGGSSSAGGTAYPPGGTGTGSVYPRSDGGIIGQAG